MSYHCLFHFINPSYTTVNDFVRLETGDVKYRPKSVNSPDVSNHWQHTQPVWNVIHMVLISLTNTIIVGQERRMGHSAVETCQWQKPFWLLAYVDAHHKLRLWPVKHFLNFPLPLIPKTMQRCIDIKWISTDHIVLETYSTYTHT